MKKITKFLATTEALQRALHDVLRVVEFASLYSIRQVLVQAIDGEVYFLASNLHCTVVHRLEAGDYQGEDTSINIGADDFRMLKLWLDAYPKFPGDLLTIEIHTGKRQDSDKMVCRLHPAAQWKAIRWTLDYPDSIGENLAQSVQTAIEATSYNGSPALTPIYLIEHIDNVFFAPHPWGDDLPGIFRTRDDKTFGIVTHSEGLYHAAASIMSRHGGFIRHHLQNTTSDYVTLGEDNDKQ